MITTVYIIIYCLLKDTGTQTSGETGSRLQSINRYTNKKVKSAKI